MIVSGILARALVLFGCVARGMPPPTLFIVMVSGVTYIIFVRSNIHTNHRAAMATISSAVACAEARREFLFYSLSAKTFVLAPIDAPLKSFAGITRQSAVSRPTSINVAVGAVALSVGRTGPSRGLNAKVAAPDLRFRCTCFRTIGN